MSSTPTGISLSRDSLFYSGAQAATFSCVRPCASRHLGAMADAHVSSRDVDEHISSLKQCKIISEDAVKALCEKAKEILMEESNVHHVPIPAVVVRARR